MITTANGIKVKKSALCAQYIHGGCQVPGCECKCHQRAEGQEGNR